MKNLLLICTFFLLISILGFTQSKPRVYEVRIKASINNCSSYHDMVVEATNIYDAREKAQRLVAHKLTTKVMNSKEVKK